MTVPRLKTVDYIDRVTQINFNRTSQFSSKKINLHCHEFMEIVIINEGSLVHQVSSDSVTSREGTIILVRPDDQHCFYKPENQTAELVNLAFPMELYEDLTRFAGKKDDFNQLLHQPCPPEGMLHQLEKTAIVTEIENSVGLAITDKELSRLHSRCIILNILVKYFLPTIPAEPEWQIPDWLNEICLKIRENNNFLQGIRILDKTPYRSQEHIIRSFRKYFHCTPTEYINKLRLDHAANLLINTDEKISSIQFDSGFHNVSHFYRIFKKRFSLSPAEFRKMRTRNIINFQS